jgi:hypothetical protein
MTTAGSTASLATEVIGTVAVHGPAGPAQNIPAALAGITITPAAPVGTTLVTGTTGTEPAQRHSMTLVLQSER